jgi:hypothetical protein
MVHDHLKRVRLDRRALRRRDWISPEELKRELEALPDVSDKIDVSSPDSAPEADGEGVKAGA